MLDNKVLQMTPGETLTDVPIQEMISRLGAGIAEAQLRLHQTAVMFGAAINVEYHRKYSFDVTGSSMVRAKMISVPAPAAFLDMLKEQARTGGTISTSGSTPTPTPTPDPGAGG